MSSENPTPPRAKKPASAAASLAGVRVASDEEIRAAAQAEIARIRAEIAQQKNASGEGIKDMTEPIQTAPADSGQRRRTPSKSSTETPTVQKSPSVRKVVPLTTPLETPDTSDLQKEQQSLPPKKTQVRKKASTDAPSARNSLLGRIFSRAETKAATIDFKIKRWKPTPEEAAVLRTQKIRRLRVLVAVTATVFIGLLGIIIYLSTGGLVHPTQGVTTEWGTATQVNTLVDKFSTPSAGNHVIVHLPGEARAESVVLGFLQGFDGTDYLVTIGSETITVPQEDFVGTVTAIWPSLF